jgi:hypothetical protein
VASKENCCFLFGLQVKPVVFFDFPGLLRELIAKPPALPERWASDPHFSGIAHRRAMFPGGFAISSRVILFMGKPPCGKQNAPMTKKDHRGLTGGHK